MEDKTFELMEKLYSEMLGMKSEMQKTNERLDRLEGRFDNIEVKMDGLETKVDSIEMRFDTLESKVDKNTIMLEELNNKVKVIAECQVAFTEQLGRTHENNGKTINDRLEIIELAVTSNSKNYGRLQTILDVVKDKVGINTMDIEILNKNYNGSH